MTSQAGGSSEASNAFRGRAPGEARPTGQGARHGCTRINLSPRPSPLAIRRVHQRVWAVWIRDPGRGRVPPVPGRFRSSPRIPTTLPDHAKANGKRFLLGYILGGGLAGIHASIAREAAREA